MIYIKYNKNTGDNYTNNNGFIQLYAQNQSRSRICIHVSLPCVNDHLVCQPLQ